MNLYDSFMNPLEKRFLKRIRKKCLRGAKGNVLEIGIGTGVNLPYYNDHQVDAITGLDISLSKEIIDKTCNKLKLVEGDVGALPFPDHSFDTVVATLLLCSVKSPDDSIREIKRVLKDGGKYIFIEHIMPGNRRYRSLFNLLNKLWSKVASGCNINRKTDITIKRSGFTVLKMKKEINSIFCYGIAEKR